MQEFSLASPSELLHQIDYNPENEEKILQLLPQMHPAIINRKEELNSLDSLPV